MNNASHDHPDNLKQANKLIEDGYVNTSPDKLAQCINLSKKLPEGSKLDLIDMLLLD